VTACCASWHLLGRVTGPERRSLREIWQGAEAEALRRAVDAEDWSLGCWECGRAMDRGDRAESIAPCYDDLTGTGPDGFPQFIDFALSNRCNLQCAMCNGGLSSTIRSQREGRPPMAPAYDDRFFAELDEFLPHLRRATFKGGEPFLVDEHRRVWDRMVALDLRPAIDITTNGTVLTDAIEEHVRALAMRVTISVDAVDPEVLAAVRVGVDPDRLWRNVDRFARIGEDIGEPVALTFCLMPQTWRELVPVLREADRRGLGTEVIVVDGPRGFGLAGLARPDLEVVADGLAEAALAADLSEGSLARLHDAVGAVRGLLARSATPGGAGAPAPSGTPVELGSGAIDRRRRELRQTSGVEPFEVTYRRDVAVAVSEPEWAGWLEPSRWLGTGLEQAITVMSESCGGAVRSEIEPLPGGTHRGAFVLEGAVPPRHLAGFYVPVGDDAALLLAPGPAAPIATAAPSAASPPR
jgi:hypothetical protein